MFNKREIFTCDSYRWYYGWNLIWWKIEGYDPLNGINIYHPSDENSAGFVVKVGKWQFRLRWSKRAKKLFWGFVCWKR